MKLIEYPEPDFDLEAELPADLAALADQLAADADFLAETFPAQQSKSNSHAEHAAGPHTKREGSGKAEGYGAAWWLRAAAIVLVLTALGTVLNNRDERLGSCPVAGDVLDKAASDLPQQQAIRRPAYETATELAPLPEVNQRVVLSESNGVVASKGAFGKASFGKVAPVVFVTSERAFHSLTSAQQEALLDLNPAASGASVDF